MRQFWSPNSWQASDVKTPVQSRVRATRWFQLFLWHMASLLMASALFKKKNLPQNNYPVHIHVLHKIILKYRVAVVSHVA